MNVKGEARGEGHMAVARRAVQTQHKSSRHSPEFGSSYQETSRGVRSAEVWGPRYTSEQPEGS